MLSRVQLGKTKKLPRKYEQFSSSNLEASEANQTIVVFPCTLQYTPKSRFSLLILFAITAAGVVPCGGPKKSPRTSSIVQIIFFCWSFEIRVGILGNQKLLIGLDSFS